MNKVGSLFAGIGGLDKGFEDAGFETSFQVEIDADARKILERHFPDAKRFIDVRSVGVTCLPAADILVGGFPCQDLSVAGKRKGLAGSRSSLWFEYHRLIEELRPKWVVIENVPGLLTANAGYDFSVVLGGLTGKLFEPPEGGWQSGGFARGWYNVAWRVLDARYFGVPQRRRRVFVVASLGSGGCAEILFEQESLRGIGEASAPKGKEDTGVPGSRAFSVTFCDANGTRKDRPNGGCYINETEEANTLTGAGANGTLVAHPGCPEVSGTLAASGAGTERTSRSGNQLDFLIPVARTITTKEGLRQKVDQDNLLPVGGAVRRLTPVECERLQGFPDGWTDGQADGVRYKQLGNAIAVPVARWIAERIKKVQG